MWADELPENHDDTRHAADPVDDPTGGDGRDAARVGGSRRGDLSSSAAAHHVHQRHELKSRLGQDQSPASSPSAPRAPPLPCSARSLGLRVRAPCSRLSRSTCAGPWQGVGEEAERGQDTLTEEDVWTTDTALRRTQAARALLRPTLLPIKGVLVFLVAFACAMRSSLGPTVLAVLARPSLGGPRASREPAHARGGTRTRRAARPTGAPRGARL